MSELTTLQILMLETEIKEIGEAIMELHGQYKKVLAEAVDDFLSNDADLGFMFEEARKRFLAAKRGLALANRLPDPAQRKQHKAQVMGNLNKLRAIFNRLDKAIQNVMQQAQQDSQGKDLFQQSQPGVQDKFQPSQQGQQGQQQNAPQQQMGA